MGRHGRGARVAGFVHRSRRLDHFAGPRPRARTNGIYEVKASVGAKGIHVRRAGRPMFGDKGLSAVTVEDPWGSWGGMAEEPESLDLSTVRDAWTISQVHVLERGPTVYMR